MIGESLLEYKISLVGEFKASQLDKIIVAVPILSVLKGIKSILHEKGTTLRKMNRLWIVIVIYKWKVRSQVYVPVLRKIE
ncbi:hypothetical protein AM501_15395 [Aneurinibacillus migulanus]|nr:hypothetical protein TS64_18730 [Aneurinibacillus migulanus]KPD07427.1 hypothetical protein AM501_15395 [Aneurinibacillus migulanus]